MGALAVQVQKNYLNYSWFHHILSLKINGESEFINGTSSKSKNCGSTYTEKGHP